MKEENHEREDQSASQDHSPATLDPRAERRKKTCDRETSLHHGAATIARTPLFDRRGSARLHASRMFHKVDVDGGASEDA